MVKHRRRQRAAARAMRAAKDYNEWREAASALDSATGLTAWREDDECLYFDGATLRAQITRLREPHASDTPEVQADFLHSALHRHLNGVLTPALFEQAHAGTKRIVVDYLDAVEAAIMRLTHAEIPGWSAAQKLALIKREARNLGDSALLFSGGATLGFYHLGVVRGLHRARLMPRVISGASMGSLIAAAVCCRTDAELDEMMAPEIPEIHRLGFKWRSPREAWRRRSLACPEQLLKTIEENAGRYTFEEAFARSGRVLNISLWPTRLSQKPRVLNHLTAPRVWIPEASQASAAVPGLFPAASLKQRARDGSTRPYIPEERWVDGSFGADLPTDRIRRLHNVNHFIVSQTQPHALPLLQGVRRRGWTGLLTGSVAAIARAQGLPLMSLGRSITARTPLATPANLMHAFITQRMSGDIDIYPRFEPTLYRKLFTNPTREELGHFVREGERATWPRLEQIRCHTQIVRCLERCVAHLEGEAAPPSSPEGLRAP